MNRSAELERVLAEAMVQSVYEKVYDAYEPVSYERREDDNGLADPRNMVISSVDVVNGGIQLIFENIAEGNDSLRGMFLADTIEEGIKANWSNPNGAYSEPRRFVEETANKLRANPGQWIEAIKSGLQQKGFTIK